MNNIFQLGDFTLASGRKYQFKIDLDYLQEEDWETLAWLVHSAVGRFKSVSGVPKGGLKLAEHLQKFCEVEGPHLIVNDILTTGGSMDRERDKYLSDPENYRKEVIGAVVINRGPLGHWATSLFHCHYCLWSK